MKSLKCIKKTHHDRNKFNIIHFDKNEKIYIFIYISKFKLPLSKKNIATEKINVGTSMDYSV